MNQWGELLSCSWTKERKEAQIHKFEMKVRFDRVCATKDKKVGAHITKHHGTPYHQRQQHHTV